MKKLYNAIIILITLVPIYSSAQDKCFKKLSDNLCLVMEDGQYGVMNKNKYVIPSYFDTIIPVEGDFYIVRQRQNWGLFNSKGSVLVPVAYYSVTPVDVKNGLFEIAGHGTRNIALINNHFDVFHQRHVNEKWMIGNTEVSLHEYLCFMQAVIMEEPKDISLEMIMPDTLCMDKKCLPALRAVLNAPGSGCTQPLDFIKEYNLSINVDCKASQQTNLVSSLSYPMTCLSYDQAQLYIHWLAEKLTISLEKKNEPYYFIARLPHPYEWEELAFKGLTRDEELRGIPDSVDAKKCTRFAFKTNQTVCVNYNAKTEKSANGMSEVYCHQPDKMGNYGIFGNVAEMTSEKKLCKGGSYLNYARECKYDRIMTYQKPAPWLGFRYILEVRRKE
jgi:formylglycine-generating enzyme required for sulfatase activity